MAGLGELSARAPFAQRRGYFEIIAEILEICSGRGVTKTALVYKSSLNFARIEKYTELLTKMNLLGLVFSEQGTLFKTTEKGYEALDALRVARTKVFGYLPDEE